MPAQFVKFTRICPKAQRMADMVWTTSRADLGEWIAKEAFL